MSVPDTTVSVPLAGLPEARAAAALGAPAIADDAVQLDNAAFADRVARAAALLTRLGVGPGDVVAIALPNRLELVIALFAAWRLGAAATPVNPALTRDEMQYQVDDAGAKVVIGEGLELDARASTLAELAARASSAPRGRRRARRAGAADLHERHDRPAQGRDARPRKRRRDVRHGAASLGITAEDHSLLVLPLFHVNGIIAGTLSPLLAGGQVTVPGRFSPKTFFGIVERVRPTYFSAVPAMYAMLTSLPKPGAPTPPPCGSWCAARRRCRPS